MSNEIPIKQLLRDFTIFASEVHNGVKKAIDIINTPEESPWELINNIELWIMSHQLTQQELQLPKLSDFISDINTFALKNISKKIKIASKNCYRSSCCPTRDKTKNCRICNTKINQYWYDNNNQIEGVLLANGEFQRRNGFGWYRFCKQCYPYILLDKERREKFNNYLPLTTYKHLEYRYIKLWCSHKMLYSSPFLIDDAELSLDCDQFIIYDDDDHINCKLNWIKDSIEYDGVFNLPNIIFHNRDIFGYSYETVLCNILSNGSYIRDIIWRDKWIRLFKKEYDIANQWDEFNKIALQDNN